MVKMKTVGFRGFQNFFYSSHCIYLWLLLEATSKTNRSGKSLASFSLIAIFAIIIFAVPLLMGKEISPALSVSALILVSVYVILSFELLHRTSIALLGATVIVSCLLLLGSIEAPASFDFVIDVIDFNTLGLLLGMMIIVAILSESGIFQWVGIKATKMSGGNLWKLMLILCTFTAVVSMFIDNVTTVLLMIPITVSVFRTFRISPIPFIIAQALASNIGGAATLIGDPPNIMIGSAANIDFNTFLVNMGPTVAVAFGVSLLLFKVFFRNDLRAAVSNLEKVMSEDENKFLKDKKILKKSVLVLLGVIVMFGFHGSLHLEVSIIALGGAAVLLAITRANPEKVMHEVDWTTLIFFTGLFIIVGAAEHAGLIGVLSSVAINATGGNPWLTFLMIIWLAAIASAFIDNIPLTATMIPLIHSLNSDPNIMAAFGGFSVSPLWWALALGADFGGNGTLIGSSAGVVSVGMSEKQGYPIGFNRWFKVGFPFMIITVAVATVVLSVQIILHI
jgi:Na+/H+ antiporter NhaD/arsenite permease-like protein